ncbi:MAG: ABC transporter permease [Bacteroidetes bacterium]|nr:ABC transporter permease [Bacteroidota bacterium]
MFRNLVVVAIRSFLRRKLYTLVNIFGLAVGVAACALILLYAGYELSYDEFNPKADRVFKLVAERRYPDHTSYYATVPPSYAQTAQNEFPEIKNNLRVLVGGGKQPVTYRASDKDIRTFEEEYWGVADSSFFSFFNLKMLQGDMKTALSGPHQVVITRSIARKYFRDEDPINKVLSSDFGDSRVTGVCEDMPMNSHLRIDFILSMVSEPFWSRNDFTTFDTHTYFELNPGADPDQLMTKFPQLVDRYAAAEIEQDLKVSWADYKKAGNGYRYALLPLRSIHLDSQFVAYAATPGGNLKYVYATLLIALLILLVACINFTNLSTARASERAREVGIRKVVGSLRRQLVTQFLMESVFLAMAAMIIGFVLAWMFLPQFSSMVNRDLHFELNRALALKLFAGAVGVGILAGVYPALVLSGFKPAVIIKGNVSGTTKGGWLRSGLLVFQFAVSIILITCTIVVRDQMHFIQSTTPGFDKELVLMIDRAWDLEQKKSFFMEELRSMPGVRGVAAVSGQLGTRNFGGVIMKPVGSDEVLNIRTMSVDDEFVDLMGLKVIKGRGFSKETADSASLIINETAVKIFGLEDPIGRRLTRTVGKDTWVFTVIGVVRDFHFQSMREVITPLAIGSCERDNGGTNLIAVRLTGQNIPQTIKAIESKWIELAEKKYFDYYFLDQSMMLQYEEERRSGELFSSFAKLAIAISCVGLFALSAYTVSLRRKEIGIRKVLGASAPGVVALFSKEFTRLVLISFILSVPLAWWMMDTWLQAFAYRISLGAWPFVAAGGSALAIGLLTVSYQTIRAAMTNPVDVLKVE